MKDLLTKAKWTNNSWLVLPGCSAPIQTWIIPELEFRLSFERDFWARMALVKELLSRGRSWDYISQLEQKAEVA